MKPILKAFCFFLDHAGSIVGEHAKGALALARAEAYAEAQGWHVEWEPDYDGDLGDHAYWCRDERAKREHTHEVLCALLKNAEGEALGCTGGVIDPGNNYARVVAAELALEAMPEDLQRRAIEDRRAGNIPGV